VRELKRQFKIAKRSGTIISASDGMVSVFASDRLMYHIDLKKEAQFARIGLSVGDVVWLYCVPEKNQILTVMKQGEQDEPPEPEQSVELVEE